MSFIEKVKNLESELLVTKEQIDRTSTSKLDNMLSVQKFVSDKTRLGCAESGLSTMVTPTKFFPSMSMPKPGFRVLREKALAIRKIRVDLSNT